ncbi:hypothetical protein EB001_27195, partial [bacterium]|nr:hypothetical protein [bacterium]
INANNSRRNGASERRYRENNDRTVNPNRVYLNNRPYIVDSITEYTIPRNQIFPSVRNMTNAMETSAHNLFNDIFNNFMEPVEVYPTQSQIESATRRVRYCDISRPINTQCPITMDDFNDSDMVTVIRPCGHIFQTEHLMNWFRTNCRCPVCRYDIRNYNSNASTEFFNTPSQNNTTSNRSLSQPEITSVDYSNNNLDGNYINRMDSINSVGSNTSNNLYNDILNESILNNLSGFTDLSGNTTDSMFGGAAVAMALLNAMNRTRMQETGDSLNNHFSYGNTNG